MLSLFYMLVYDLKVNYTVAWNYENLQVFYIWTIGWLGIFCNIVWCVGRTQSRCCQGWEFLDSFIWKWANWHAKRLEWGAAILSRIFSYNSPGEVPWFSLIHRLITSEVCLFFSIWWLCLGTLHNLLGDLFIAGFCVIGHFIKWHQTLLMLPLMVLLEWSAAVSLQ